MVYEKYGTTSLLVSMVYMNENIEWINGNNLIKKFLSFYFV